MGGRVPSYRRHGANRVRVTINGKDYLLGAYGSPESKREHARMIAEWAAQDYSKSFGIPVTQYTVVQLSLLGCSQSEIGKKQRVTNRVVQSKLDRHRKAVQSMVA